MMLVSDFSQTKRDLESSSPETITFVQARPAEAGNLGVYQPQRQNPRIALMFDPGYSWRTAKLVDGLEDFMEHIAKQVMSGFMLDGAFAYYFNDIYGIGLCFNQFMASTEQFAQNQSTGKTGNYKVSSRITYIGPAFMMQTMLGKSAWLLDVSFGIGYIEYKNKHSFVDEKVTFSGASVGFHSEVGLSYKITSEWALGFKLHSTDGTLNQLTEIDYTSNKTTHKFESKKGESLSQFGLSLGIRYYFK